MRRDPVGRALVGLLALVTWLVVQVGCNRSRSGGIELPGPDDFAIVEEDGGASARDVAGEGDLVLVDLSGVAVELSAGIDLSAPGDLRSAMDDLRPPSDLMMTRPPCMRGTGFSAFRFHYSGSTSAIVDALGLPDRTNFEAVPAYATSFVDGIHGGGINIAGGNWLLIRYSVVGLSRINKATFSVYGRSYSVGSSGSFEAWSPIYGGALSPVNSISNAWPYSWTSIDFSSFLRVGDPPALTGIRLYARASSSNLVINTVELCIDGS